MYNTGPITPQRARRSPARSTRVHLFDLLAVALRHHLALHFEARGELARLGGEVPRQDAEVLDRLVRSELLVHRRHLALDQLAHPGMRCRLLRGCAAEPLRARPAPHLLLIERDERRAVLAVVAD